VGDGSGRGEGGGRGGAPGASAAVKAGRGGAGEGYVICTNLGVSVGLQPCLARALQASAMGWPMRARAPSSMAVSPDLSKLFVTSL